jgi:hypothetical protein
MEFEIVAKPDGYAGWVTEFMFMNTVVDTFIGIFITALK